MASAQLSRRVEKVVGYPPLCDMDKQQRREFQEALLDAVGATAAAAHLRGKEARAEAVSSR